MGKQSSAPADVLSFEDAASSPDTLSFEEAAPATMSFEAASQTGGAERGPAPPAPGAVSPTLKVPGAPSQPWQAGTQATPYEAPNVTGNRLVDIAIEPVTGLHRRIVNAFEGSRDKLFYPGMQDLAKGDLSGLAGAIPGAAGMAFAPVGGALEPVSRPINDYVAPLVQKVFGTPPEITTPVLTALVPGLGVTRIPGGPRVPAPSTFKPSYKPQAPRVEPEAPKIPGEAASVEPIAPTKPVVPATDKKIASLDKRIQKAQTGLDGLATVQDAPPELALDLKTKIAKWTAERDALAGAVKETPKSKEPIKIHDDGEGDWIAPPPDAAHRARLAEAKTKYDAWEAELKKRQVAAGAELAQKFGKLRVHLRRQQDEAHLNIQMWKEELDSARTRQVDDNDVEIAKSDELGAFISGRRKAIAEEEESYARIKAAIEKSYDDQNAVNIGDTPGIYDGLGEPPKAPRDPRWVRVSEKTADSVTWQEAHKLLDAPSEASKPPRSPGAVAARLTFEEAVSPARGPAGGSAPPPLGGGNGVPPRSPGGTPPSASTPPIPPRSKSVLPGAIDYIRRLAGNIEKILSPTTVDAHAQTAEALLRRHQGAGARDAARADVSLEEFKAKINRMPEAEQYKFIDYVETRTGAAKIADATLQPVADTLRGIMTKIRVQLEALPPTERMRFIEEYFPHQWADDPATIAEFFNKREGAAKEGKGGFTKKRAIPTVAEGLQAGLRLKNPNPLEATMAYVDNAVKFIAQGKVFSAARDLGIAKFYTPGKQPEGWAELTGRYGGKLSAVGQMRAYAPEGFARVYNNAISKKFTGPEGELLQGLQQTSNWATGLELGLSGFHAATMSQEAMVSGVAAAIRELYTGHPVRAAGALLKTPTNPIGYALTGGKMQRLYSGGKYKSTLYQSAVDKLTPGAARLHKVVDLLEKAGGRAMKIDQEYLASRQGDYVKAFKRAALGKQLKGDVADIKQRPLVGTAAVIARHMARIVDTVSAPMFQEWIPRLKLGAFDEHMSAWLRRNPAATEDTQVAAAREIWDSVDNRFGEMVRDNIFWKNTHKQSMQIMLRSYTWTFGAGREIAGGVWDAAKVPYKVSMAAGKYLEGKPVTAKDMPKVTQRMDYILALPIIYATWNAALTYLYTGEQPEGHDFVAGRTGGVDAASGQPERVVAPGFMKDVYGWTEKGIPGELYNKTATVPRTAIELALNKDWRGLPIAPESFVNDPEAPSWLNEYAMHVLDNLGPFSVKNILRGQKDGSNIGSVETVLGLQPAGKKMTDPDGYEGMMQNLQNKNWQRKMKADGREREKYNGPQ